MFFNTLLAVFFLSFGAPAFSQNLPKCPNSDPKKAILFIDLNGSAKEIEAAARGACARGESLITIPPYAESLKLHNKVVRRDALEKKYNAIVDKQNISESDQLKLKQYNDEIDAISIYVDEISGTYDLDAALDGALSSLSKQGVSVSTLIVSGHSDGSRESYGYFGSIDFNDLRDAMSVYPKIFTDLELYLGWGCYSSTPSTIAQWNTFFPQLKIIAGFSSSAPSGLRPANWQYLEDILKKSDKILAQCDESKLLKAIKSVEGLDSVIPGIYVENSSCGAMYFADENQGHFDPQSDTDEDSNYYFGKYNGALDCDYLESRSTSKYKLYQKYLDGSLEPPEETQNTDLRALYSYSRQWSACSESNSYKLFDAAHIGLLLFYNGVKKNFEQVFKADLTKADALWKGLEVDSVRASFDAELNAEKNKLSQIENSIAQLEAARELNAKKLDEQYRPSELKSAMTKIIDELNGKVEGIVQNGTLTIAEKTALVEDKAHFAQKKFALEYLALLKKQEAYSSASAELESKYKKEKLKLDSDREVQQSKCNSLQNSNEDALKKISSFKSLATTFQTTALGSLSRADLIKNYKAYKASTLPDALIKKLPVPMQNDLTFIDKNVERIKRHLIDLDSDCMGMLDWHEYTPSNLPDSKCR